MGYNTRTEYIISVINLGAWRCSCAKHIGTDRAETICYITCFFFLNSFEISRMKKGENWGIISNKVEGLIGAEYGHEDVLMGDALNYREQLHHGVHNEKLAERSKRFKNAGTASIRWSDIVSHILETRMYFLLLGIE